MRATKSSESEYVKLAVFHGRTEDGFCLEGKGIADIVHGERLVNPLKRNEDYSDYKLFLKESRQARSIIVQALGDRPLRTIQSVPSPKEMWDKLSERYTTALQHNKISVLTTLLNKEPNSISEISDQIS